MKCYKCGSTEKVFWQRFGEGGREIAICSKCEWKYFISHIKPISKSDKQYVEQEKKRLSV